MKSDPRQPSFFDDEPPPAPSITIEREDWHKPSVIDQGSLRRAERPAPSVTAQEVGVSGDAGFRFIMPHHVWLSWPKDLQMRYCAARDRESAVLAETPAERQWFLDRANWYAAHTV